MQPLNINLPEPLSEALSAYSHDWGITSPDEVVQVALEEFLLQRGYLSQQKQRLRLTPASQGSGFSDTSINHDKILAEQAQLQKLSQQPSQSQARS